MPNPPNKRDKKPPTPLSAEERRAAETLKAAQERSGHTQEAIAAALGVTQGAVWQWLNGDTRVPAKRAVQLCSIIGQGLTPEQISPSYAATIRPVAAAVLPALTPAGRTAGDIDAIRIAVAALYETLVETTPTAIPVLREALGSGVTNPRDLTRGFLAQLAKSLDQALASKAEVPAETQPRGAA